MFAPLEIWIAAVCVRKMRKFQFFWRSEKSKGKNVKRFAKEKPKEKKHNLQTQIQKNGYDIKYDRILPLIHIIKYFFVSPLDQQSF